VWTYLENWLVQDGEIPELQAGDELHHVAVRGTCWSVAESQAPEGLTELRGQDPAGDVAPHYELTGTVEWAREPSTLLLRVGTVRVLAEPNSFRTVRPGSGDAAGAEPYSPSFWVPAIGTRVTAVCRLEVMADYETDALAFPDIRRDWRVGKVLVEHRSRVQPTTGGGDSIVGRVVRVDTIDRMRRWADENGRDHVTYCLDLRIRR